MDYNEAFIILQYIRSSKQNNLSDKLIQSAVRYAQLRVAWILAEAEERRILNAERTHAHNALITNCDILARNARSAGESDSWRIKLGNDRKRIGDFACYVHSIIGIEAR